MTLLSLCRFAGRVRFRILECRTAAAASSSDFVMAKLVGNWETQRVSFACDLAARIGNQSAA